MPVPASTPTRAGTDQPQGRSALAVLSAIGFLLLMAGLYYVWQRQEQMLTQSPAVDPAAFAGLDSQVRSLSPRISQLEQRNTPDLKPIEGRIAALENKPAPAPPPPPAAASPAPDISGTVAAAIAPLAQRIDGLDKADKSDQAALAAKVDGAVAKVDAAVAKIDGATSQTQQLQQTAQQLAGRVDALEQKLAAAEQRASQQAAQSAAALRGQQALTALESGKPLGTIPGAPLAVTKFATVAPPTEADLRVEFPAAAARATAVSKPSGEGQSVGARMLEHAESLVTVRQGDKVVVGSPAAQTLGRAQAKLDAGDLAGAVTALDALDTAAATAMADWRGKAQSLLQAREALNTMIAPASH